MKRFSSVVLTVVVLFSSLSFCCEQEDVCADNELNTCENEKPNSHQEDVPCSPFFKCGNCTGNILLDIPLVFQNTNLEPRSTMTPFIEKNRIKELHFKLLKPPMQRS